MVSYHMVSLGLNELTHDLEHFADIYKFISLEEKYSIFIQISLKFVPNDVIWNISALF